MNRPLIQLLLSLLLSHVVFAQIPANDNFANTQVLPGPTGTVTGSNVQATHESGEPNHAGTGECFNSVWYQWTAPFSGPVNIDTVGSNFDTLLAVYTGNVLDALTLVDRNNDGTAAGGSSLVSFNAVAGTVYQIAVDGNYAQSQNFWGNITLNYTRLGVPTAPEISIQQPVGTNVADNATRNFGSVTLGKSGTAKTFTITNTGTQALTGLVLTTTGDAQSFVVTPFSITSLAPSTSATFKVTFKPTKHGTRTAAIHIASNDADENPFDIRLTGTGVGPEITVQQPTGNNIATNATSNFGSVEVCHHVATKTFTIKNVGTRNLTGLAIAKTGGSFSVSSLAKTTLAPGASTTFKVTFKPVEAGTRNGRLRIASNDWNENPFTIKLTGLGTEPDHSPPASGSSPGIFSFGVATAGSRVQEPSKTLITVDPRTGLKYLTLEITKAPGTENQRRIVEVSPNLFDWFSGSDHTTVLRNDAAVLLVRDNTPLKPDAKRYIRIHGNLTGPSN